MAKFDLKFLANDDENINIKTFSKDNQIIIITESDNPDSIDEMTICLDKSTAIKFAKTLRTEINKIIDKEVVNG